eukprot:jgi/Psemu1/58484/gm1.58484_g
MRLERLVGPLWWGSSSRWEKRRVAIGDYRTKPQLLLLFFAFGLNQLNSQFQKEINRLTVASLLKLAKEEDDAEGALDDDENNPTADHQLTRLRMTIDTIYLHPRTTSQVPPITFISASTLHVTPSFQGHIDAHHLIVLSTINTDCDYQSIIVLIYPRYTTVAAHKKAKQLRANTNTNQRRNEKRKTNKYEFLKDTVISRQTKTKRRHAINDHLFVTSSLPIDRDRGNSSSPDSLAVPILDQLLIPPPPGLIPTPGSIHPALIQSASEESSIPPLLVLFLQTLLLEMFPPKRNRESHSTCARTSYPYPANSRWTFSPQSETVIFHRARSAPQPSCISSLQLPPSGASSKDSVVSSSVTKPLYGTSPCPIRKFLYGARKPLYGASFSPVWKPSAYPVGKPLYEAHSMTYNNRQIVLLNEITDGSTLGHMKTNKAI